MMIETFHLLAVVCGACFGVLAMCAAWGHWESFTSAREKLLRENSFWLVLDEQDIAPLAKRIAWGQLAFTGLTFLATRSIGFAVTAFVASLFVPGKIVARKVKGNREAFDDQLILSISMLSSAARAGLSLPQALEAVTHDCPKLVARELARIVGEYRHGAPLDKAIMTSRERVRSSDWNLVTSALLVNREHGGDLARALERLGNALSELKRLREKIRNETAKGRMSVTIMAVSPFVLLGIMYGMDPDSVSYLFTHPLGLTLVVIACGMVYAALVWAGKIIEEDI